MALLILAPTRRKFFESTRSFSGSTFAHDPHKRQANYRHMVTL